MVMSDPSADPHRHALDAIRRELDRLGDGGRRVVPAWKRVTPGEHRWPAAVAIVVAIGLQLLLPDQLTLVSRWLLPSLELVVLVVLAVTGPARMDRESALLRGLGLTLVGLLSVANAVSAGCWSPRSSTAPPAAPPRPCWPAGRRSG